MDLSTFIITVYCLVDAWLAAQPRLRQRGFAPTLSDSEVLTMEVVGEFLGIDTDTRLYRHFRRHYRAWFPALMRIDRSCADCTGCLENGHQVAGVGAGLGSIVTCSPSCSRRRTSRRCTCADTVGEFGCAPLWRRMGLLAPPGQQYGRSPRGTRGRHKEFANSIGTGKFRVVPLGTKVEKALDKYLEHQQRRRQPRDYVFLSDDGEPLTYQGLKMVFRRLEARTGIRCNAHKWRHSAAVQYLRGGGKVEALKTMLGHSTLDMTLVYARVAGVDLATAHAVCDPARSLKVRV